MKKAIIKVEQKGNFEYISFDLKNLPKVKNELIKKSNSDEYLNNLLIK
jgi:hypothetical protein